MFLVVLGGMMVFDLWLYLVVSSCILVFGGVQCFLLVFGCIGSCMVVCGLV